MSKVHRGGMKPRPLGAVKVSTSSTEVPKLPHLSVKQSFNGLQGNAMTVPPKAERPPADEKPVRASPIKRKTGSSKSTKSDTGSTKSDDAALEKARLELKEAVLRESDLKDQIASLQKLIEQLQVQISLKDQLISELQQQLQLQELQGETEQKYKALYEKEQKDHMVTRGNLKQVSAALDEKKKEFEDVVREHQQEINYIKRKHDIALSELKAEMAREISLRDEKLSKLKKQMADALQGNSWERQQQLDELTKELSKVQEEADMLRIRLKSKNKQGGCNNCALLQEKLDKVSGECKQRDQAVKQLQATVKKLERNKNSR